MNGILIKRLDPVFDDGKTSILEVLNGVPIHNVKFFRAKSGATAGNHWHTYVEVCYVLSGAVRYKFRNVITGERSEESVLAGELLIKSPYIWHEAAFLQDTEMLDLSEQPWIGGEFNNHYDP